MAFVPVRSGATWATFPVAYNIHVAGLPSTGNGSEFVAIHAAFETWQKVAASMITFSYEGVTDTRFMGKDYVNLISFQDDSFDFGTDIIAVTLSSSNESKEFEDSDIIFNPNLDFSTHGGPDSFDLQAIATHEIGHLLGLDHTAIVSAVMHPRVPPNPTGGRPQTFGRVLQSDDQTGSSVLYPEPEFANSTGGIEGRIVLDDAGVFGAHVVTLDEEGRSVASTLSFKDGTYRIRGLVPGSYSVYAEPLDGPVEGSNFGVLSHPRSGYIFIDFQTTFLGDTIDRDARQRVQVTAGDLLTEFDITVSPRASPPLNITSPFWGIRFFQGVQEEFRSFGNGIIAGSTFFVLGEGVDLGRPSIGSGGAEIEVEVHRDAPLGPRSLFVRRPDALSALSGGVVVTPLPSPDVISIVPDSGLRSGGTLVQVSGSNFHEEVSVSLDGIPLQDLTWLDSRTVQGTTAPNRCSDLTLLVMNPDGSSARLVSSFKAVSPPPTIDSVVPESGEVTSLVTISGANFDPLTNNTRVRFNDRPADVISISESEIVALVPFGATSGPITVETCGHIATSSVFSVIPSITSRNRAQPKFSYLDLTQDPGASRLVFQLDADGEDNDDSVSRMPLPFKFTLFTRTFPERSPVNVTSNGWISLTPSVPSTTEWENGPLPGRTVRRPRGSIGRMPGNLIAPFFDDLILERADSGVYSRVVGSVPNRRLIIEWRNLSRIVGITEDYEAIVDPKIRLTFQAVLYEGSNDIAFHYRTLQGAMARGDSSTIGLQNANRDRAIQFGFNRPRLYEGRSVFFRFNPRDGSYAFEQFVPFVTDTGEFRTNLGLTADVLSGARVNLTLFDAAGQSLGSRAVTVPGGGLVQLNHLIRYLLRTDPSAPSNLSGSVLVASDQLVFPYVTQIDNTSDDPSLDVGVMSGSTKLLILSTTSVNPYRSSLVVLNVGDVDASVTLTQRDRGGTELHREQIVIPSRGLFQSPDLHADFGISNVYGPLEIESTNEVPLIATSRVYSRDSGTSGFFRGLDLASASTDAIIPISRESEEFRSNLGINNLSDRPAKVHVHLLDSDGVDLGMTSVEVPPSGLVQLNRVNRRLSGSSGGASTFGWIRMNADQPIAGFVSLINNESSDPGFARSDVLAATKLLIPSGANINQFRSTITIINAGNESTASVRVSVRNREGQVLAESEIISIPANAVYHLDDLLGSLGVPGNFGPVEIEALNQVPILAVSRVYSIDDDTSGFFVAQPF